jgi:hypothetical protein
MAAGCWLWRVGAAAAPLRKRQLAAAEDELTKLSDEIESHGGDNAGTVELQTLDVGDYCSSHVPRYFMRFGLVHCTKAAPLRWCSVC